MTSIRGEWGVFVVGVEVDGGVGVVGVVEVVGVVGVVGVDEW